MSTYVVVADHPARSHELTSALIDRLTQDESAEFVLLVPAPPTELLLPHGGCSARDIVRRAACEAADCLRRAGLRIKWTVVADELPIVALDKELKDHPDEYAGVIIATPAGEGSRWLDLYLVRMVEALGLPLTRVVDSLDFGAVPAREALAV